jgi:hypothetical protein
MIALPDTRSDGLCVVCERKRAVTKDRRLCLPCLRRLIRRISPGNDRLGSRRTPDQQQAWDHDPSPWQEIAIRALEEGPV